MEYDIDIDEVADNATKESSNSRYTYVIRSKQPRDYPT